uniref:Uncharacterized protein n=1 Tax=Anopheles albimanus TaxID=7167 RepID=A0A182FY66_ANOAL
RRRVLNNKTIPIPRPPPGGSILCAVSFRLAIGTRWFHHGSPSVAIA